MRRHIAEAIARDPEKFAHHDRIFKNNPVVMQGMGLAPLVVLATSGKNAAMLAVAVAVAAFGLLTVHTLWARRALFHEVRRQQARERRIAAAREHDKEAADASAS